MNTDYLGKYKKITDQRKPNSGNLLEFKSKRPRKDVLKDIKTQKKAKRPRKVKTYEWRRIDQLLGLENGHE